MNEPRRLSGILKGKVDGEAFREADCEIEQMFYEETDDLTGLAIPAKVKLPVKFLPSRLARNGE